VQIAPLRAYHAPTDLAECLEILRDEAGRVTVLAGGQSAVPLLKSRQLRPEVLLDLRRVEELRRQPSGADGDGPLELGAMVRYRDIEHHPLITSRFAALADAARTIGDLQVRNRGTLGGNLAFADITADMPPVVVCLSGEVVVTGPGGDRTVPADEFFTGRRETALRPDELLRAVRFPAPAPGSGSAYEKYGITVNGRPVIGVAAQVAVDAGGTCSAARVVVGGVLPGPRRAEAAEQVLLGQRIDDDVLAAAAGAAAEEIDTHDDLRGSAEYRRQLIRIYGQRALQRAVTRAQEGHTR
jgi:CO/xanthine dehydrogenase FAD-binding subunit